MLASDDAFQADQHTVEAGDQSSSAREVDIQERRQNQAQLKLAFLLNNLGLTSSHSTSSTPPVGADAYGVIPEGLRYYKNPWASEQQGEVKGSRAVLPSAQVESKGTHDLNLENISELRAAEAARNANRGWTEKLSDSLTTFFYGNRDSQSGQSSGFGGEQRMRAKLAEAAATEEARKRRVETQRKLQMEAARKQQQVQQEDAQSRVNASAKLDAPEMPEMPTTMTPDDQVHPKVLQQRRKMLEKEQTIHQTLEVLEQNRAAHLVPSRHSVCSDEMGKVAACYNKANIAEGQFFESMHQKQRTDTSEAGGGSGWFAKGKGREKVVASESDLLLGRLTLQCSGVVNDLSACAEKTSVTNLSQ